MIKIEGWPDHPEGPATRLAVVRVASRHRPDLSDAAKQNAAQRLLNPPTTTTQPQRQRSRNDNEAATTTKPQRQCSRNDNAATTQPQPPRSGAGGAVAGLSRAPIGRAFAGKQGDACLSERSERVCIAAPRTFARSGSRRPRTSARPRPRPRQTAQPAQTQGLSIPKASMPQGLHARTPRRPAPRSDARDNQTGTGPSPRRSPAPRQAPESAIIPPLRAKPAGF